jgi:large subunit ribosomal protein L15
MNGQRSRSGSTRRPWFEGGQMPLLRRVPKRGFNNHFKKIFQIVNVSQLDKLKETDITPEALKKSGLIDYINESIKILGDGEISKSLKVTADIFTKSAVEKIKAAGGEIITR